MNRVNIQPRARAEAERVAVWYEERRPGLGIEFVLELDAAIEKAAISPLMYAAMHEETRRVLMRRFPYAVYFRYAEDLIEVFAVLHQYRDASMVLGGIQR